MSKLLYGITAWGAISGIPGCPGDYRAGISKRDLSRLQSLQNKALRLINWSDRSTPTKTLLQDSNMLSINQLIAFHILVQSFKIKLSKKPDYHYKRLFNNEKKNEQITKTRSNFTRRVEFRLNLGRSSFFYQANRIWMALPANMRECTSTNQFKTMIKKWISEKIPIKPL